jgi:hypothetical protein
MKIEFITDPVLVPGLRCPHCRGKVTQIRNAPSEHDVFTASLIEPLGWVVLGIAAFVGYLWEAIFGLTLALIIIVPVAGILLYFRSVRQGDFLCSTCGSQLTYAQAACKNRGKTINPIAEANVYLAYGRKEQAVNVLKNALAMDPNNEEVLAKLREIEHR